MPNEETLKQPGETIDLTGDIQLIAQWKRAETRTIRFDANGGAGEMPETEEKYAQTYTLPACSFTLPLYQFAGWQIGNSTDVRQPGESIYVAGDITLKACWEKKVRITLLPGIADGENVTVIHRQYAPYTLPDCAFVAPAERIFSGWYCGGQIYQPGEQINGLMESTEIAAVWHDIGSSIPGIQIVDDSLGIGSQYPAFNMFDGNRDWESRWAFSSHGDNSYVDERHGTVVFRLPTAEKLSAMVMVSTLDGNEAPKQYELYVLKDETALDRIVDEAEKEQYLRNEANWQLLVDVDNSGASKPRLGTVSTRLTMSEAHSVYRIVVTRSGAAGWVNIAELEFYRADMEGGCTVLLKDDADAKMIEDITVAQNSDWILPACTYTKHLYRFIGWKTDDGQIIKAGETLRITGDTMLIAQWEKLPVYTLTFKANGSEGHMEPVEWEQGKEMLLPNCTFTKPGYAFAGWQIGETRYKAGELYTPQADTELMAMWNKSSHAGEISGGTIKVEGCSGSTNSGEGPEMLFDGMYSGGQTKWCSNIDSGNNQWVAFSLQEAMFLIGMRVVHAKGAGEDVVNTLDYELQIMIDPAAYEALTDPSAREANLANDANWENIAVVRENYLDVTETPIENAGIGKYYRFHVTDSGDYGQWGATRVYELILEGTAAEESKLTGHSMTLADAITINFTADLGSAPSENAHMLFTFEDPRIDPIKILLSDAEKTGIVYTFRCPMAAKKMTDTVRAELYMDGSLMLTDRHSVKQYADSVLNDTTGEYDSAKPLVRAMLNYGAKAQLLFNYKTDRLANADLTEEQKEVPSAVFDDRYAFKPITETNMEGIAYAFSALDIDSRLGIKHYFTLTGNAQAYEVEILNGDGIVYAEKLADEERGKFCIEIHHICPQNLDKTYQLEISHAGGTMIVEYSPYTYARMVKNLPEGQMEPLKDLMDAMDAYRTAAQQYILQNQEGK